MTQLVVALCSLLAGASVAAAVAAWTAGGRAQPGGFDAGDLERLLRSAGEDGRRQRPGLGARMRWAGMPFGWPGLCFGGGGAALCAIWVCANLGLGPGLTGFAACLAGLAPYLVAKELIARRERSVAHGIEITAEGIARGLDSGLGFADSIVLALGACPPRLAAALRPAASGLLTGQPMRAFADALCGAAPVPAAYLLAAVLTAGSESGGQTSETLKSISAFLRDARRGRQRVETAAAEAKSASAVLMALPVAAVAGLAAAAPAHFAMLTSTPAGQAALTLSALWLITGYLVMRRIVAAALPSAGPCS